MLPYLSGQAHRARTSGEPHCRRGSSCQPSSSWEGSHHPEARCQAIHCRSWTPSSSRTALQGPPSSPGRRDPSDWPYHLLRPPGIGRPQILVNQFRHLSLTTFFPARGRRCPSRPHRCRPLRLRSWLCRCPHRCSRRRSRRCCPSRRWGRRRRRCLNTATPFDRSPHEGRNPKLPAFDPTPKTFAMLIAFNSHCLVLLRVIVPPAPVIWRHFLWFYPTISFFATTLVYSSWLIIWLFLVNKKTIKLWLNLIIFWLVEYFFHFTNNFEVPDLMIFFSLESCLGHFTSCFCNWTPSHEKG